MSCEKLDWHGLMHIGMHQLGLSTAEFWQLTPFELTVKMGLKPGQSQVMTRSGLSDLINKFPDKASDL
jgi:uncharacterized phage protein (TIGR02216 family)